MTRRETILYAVLIGVCLTAGSWYAGFVIGGHITHTADEWLSFRKLAETAELESFVMDAYRNENPEIGIWALKRLAEYLEGAGELGILGRPFNSDNPRPMDLALTQVRLSLLLRKVGRATDAEECLSKAVGVLNGTDREKLTAEQLVWMVEELDRRSSEQTSGANPGFTAASPE